MPCALEDDDAIDIANYIYKRVITILSRTSVDFKDARAGCFAVVRELFIFGHNALLISNCNIFKALFYKQ